MNIMEVTIPVALPTSRYNVVIQPQGLQHLGEKCHHLKLGDRVQLGSGSGAQVVLRIDAISDEPNLLGTFTVARTLPAYIGKRAFRACRLSP